MSAGVDSGGTALPDYTRKRSAPLPPINLLVNSGSHRVERCQLLVNGEAHRNRGLEGPGDRAGHYTVEGSHGAANTTCPINTRLREVLARFCTHGVSPYFQRPHDP